MKPKIIALIIFAVVYVVATAAAWKESRALAFKRCPLCGAYNDERRN